MLDRRYRNVRADDCSTLRPGAGSMTVRYQGAEYMVTGVYFMTRSGRHEICYVLRPALLTDESTAGDPVQRLEPAAPPHQHGGL